MTYIISIIMLALCLVKKNSRNVYIFAFIVFWILFGWSSNNADYQIYVGRYNNYSGQILNLTEPLFTALMRIFNMINLDYTQFLIVISFIILMVYFIFIKKSTKQTCFVLVIYFIFPFCIDVCQLRFSIATIFSTIGLYYLIFDENVKRSIIKYIIFIFLAGMIHFAMLFLLLLIIPKILDLKQTIIITFVALIILQIFMTMVPNIEIQGTNVLAGKINFVLDYANQKYNTEVVLVTVYRVIIFFVLYLIINRIVIKRIYSQKENVEEYDKKINALKLVLKMNIFILVILPLLSISVDLYRVQVTLSLINIITYSYFFIKQKRGTINLYNIMFILICILFNMINLYLLVLRNTNIDTVWWPLFNNNLLI